MSKMSQDQAKPVTYGAVFGAEGKLGEDPVKPGDASLMQSTEAKTFGQVQRGGAASVMQSAATKNVNAGLVGDGDRSQRAAEHSVAVQAALVPGAEVDVEYVEEQAVMSRVRPAPTEPQDLLTVISPAMTMTDALEAAGIASRDQEVQDKDARAIQSAVHRAAGVPPTPGATGLAAAAQSAADMNPRLPAPYKTTIGDVLIDASVQMDADKVVTQEDAAKVVNAELRGSPTGVPRPGGVGAAVQAAADINQP